MLLVAEGITGGGVLQADSGGDVAGVDSLNILTVVGVHLQDTAHALTLALGGVQHACRRHRSCRSKRGRRSDVPT